MTIVLQAEAAEMGNAGEKQHGGFTGIRVGSFFPDRCPMLVWASTRKAPVSPLTGVFELAFLKRLINPGLKGVFSVLFYR